MDKEIYFHQVSRAKVSAFISNLLEECQKEAAKETNTIRTLTWTSWLPFKRTGTSITTVSSWNTSPSSPTLCRHSKGSWQTDWSQANKQGSTDWPTESPSSSASSRQSDRGSTSGWSNVPEHKKKQIKQNWSVPISEPRHSENWKKNGMLNTTTLRMIICGNQPKQ